MLYVSSSPLRLGSGNRLGSDCGVAVLARVRAVISTPICLESLGVYPFVQRLRSPRSAFAKRPMFLKTLPATFGRDSLFLSRRDYAAPPLFHEKP